MPPCSLSSVTAASFLPFHQSSYTADPIIVLGNDSPTAKIVTDLCLAQQFPNAFNHGSLFWETPIPPAKQMWGNSYPTSE